MKNQNLLFLCAHFVLVIFMFGFRWVQPYKKTKPFNKTKLKPKPPLLLTIIKRRGRTAQPKIKTQRSYFLSLATSLQVLVISCLDLKTFVRVTHVCKSIKAIITKNKSCSLSELVLNTETFASYFRACIANFW